MKNKKVLILGMGISGSSVAEYLLSGGAEALGVDKRAKEITSSKIPLFEESDPRVLEMIHEVDFVVKSPGIGWDHPLVKAAQKEKEILSEVELAFRDFKSRNKTLLGITGSNGKTTTTMLTTHVLNACGKKALSCGNIGTPLILQLDREEPIFVIELSSYQIETLSTQALDFAVILNITENHLERYASFDAYAKAKCRIESLLKKGGKLFVQEGVKERFSHHLHTFFPFPPLKMEENVATIFPLRYRDGRFSHDFENCRAAFALCRELGVDEESFWEALKSFVKPPHRLEFVRERRGVAYVNDSKATSVDAVIKGVDSILGDVILIAGGYDKGGSYKKWADALKGKVKYVFLIGNTQEKIYNEITPALKAEKVKTLEEAIKRASERAMRGETVLLSPGCASYDQFQNFEHRGEVFKKLVLRR